MQNPKYSLFQLSLSGLSMLQGTKQLFHSGTETDLIVYNNMHKIYFTKSFSNTSNKISLQEHTPVRQIEFRNNNSSLIANLQAEAISLYCLICKEFCRYIVRNEVLMVPLYGS